MKMSYRDLVPLEQGHVVQHDEKSAPRWATDAMPTPVEISTNFKAKT